MKQNKFLDVGMISICLNRGFYLALINFLDSRTVLSKKLNYLIGAMFALTASKGLMFQANLAHVNFMTPLLIHAFLVFANLLFSRFWKSKFLVYSLMILGAVFLTATFVSNVISFVGMHIWVFNEKESSHALS